MYMYEEHEYLISSKSKANSEYRSYYLSRKASGFSQHMHYEKFYIDWYQIMADTMSRRIGLCVHFHGSKECIAKEAELSTDIKIWLPQVLINLLITENYFFKITLKRVGAYTIIILYPPVVCPSRLGILLVSVWGNLWTVCRHKRPRRFSIKEPSWHVDWRAGIGLRHDLGVRPVAVS